MKAMVMAPVWSPTRPVGSLDPAVHHAIAAWAGDELRSTNAQIEFLLRRALAQSGRLPNKVGDLPRRGRPPRSR